MPGQWEFQIGYRDIESESADPTNGLGSFMGWLAGYFID